MFKPELPSPPAAALPPPAAGPAAGIASTLDEARSWMPAAPFSCGGFGGHALRQREIGRQQCRWIIADADAGAEALMCGASAEPRRPFCAEHCARAFVKVAQDEDAEAASIAEAEDSEDRDEIEPEVAE